MPHIHQVPDYLPSPINPSWNVHYFGRIGILVWLVNFLITLIMLIVIIFRERRSASATWAWIFLITAIPIFGFILYLIIGRGISNHRMFDMRFQGKIPFYWREWRDNHRRKELSFLKDYSVDRDLFQLITMNSDTENSILSLNTEVTFLSDGQEKFDALIKDIKAAKYHIHVEYYIFRMDSLGQIVYQALLGAQKRGVQVRILLDAWGSRTAKLKEFTALLEAGGEVAYFFPSIIPILNPRTNYRLHRKIVVIDGEIGYTGGYNVGEEYIGKSPRFGYWRDNHLRLKGDVVYPLQNRFILDWNSQKGKGIKKLEDYFPAIESKGSIPAQFITSGPESDKDNIKMNYLKMINSAKREIVIQSPYYVPDSSIQEALKLALMSGVRVILMIPNKPDHPFVYWASYSNATELLEYGAEIYTYQNGFLHAKTLLIDDRVVSIGSANFDYRSFQLDFEGNVLIYDESFVQLISQKIQEDIQDSHLVTQKEYDARGNIKKIKEALSRLIAPLL